MEIPKTLKVVCWVKHGPYADDEPQIYVFDDPQDDDCYSPLYMFEGVAAYVLEEVAKKPVAYIEHHKGGDNLVWDKPGNSYTALYTFIDV